MLDVKLQEVHIPRLLQMVAALVGGFVIGFCVWYLANPPQDGGWVEPAGVISSALLSVILIIVYIEQYELTKSTEEASFVAGIEDTGTIGPKLTIMNTGNAVAENVEASWGNVQTIDEQSWTAAFLRPGNEVSVKLSEAMPADIGNSISELQTAIEDGRIDPELNYRIIWDGLTDSNELNGKIDLSAALERIEATSTFDPYEPTDRIASELATMRSTLDNIAREFND